MESRIAVEKLPYYVPTPERIPDLTPVRHACGCILHANLDGEWAIFHTDIKGKTPRIEKCPHCEYPLDMDWMRPLWHVRPMPYWMAVLTVARRVCSNCWGRIEMNSRDIVIENDEGIMEGHRIVYCRNCLYETIGYVTHCWVEICRQKDFEEYETVLPGLSEALGIELAQPETPKPQSTNQLLTQMGF